MAEEVITVFGDGITVSQLVWRRFRREMPGMVEAVLTRNPGLSANIYIPIGRRVIFPEPPAPASNVITLWE